MRERGSGGVDYKTNLGAAWMLQDDDVWIGLRICIAGGRRRSLAQGRERVVHVVFRVDH